MRTYDLAIIGAGVVGCALARKLAKHQSVLVIERHSQAGQETSLLNSGVIHSGIHLPPGYLKAELARKGSKQIIEYCYSNDLPIKKAGMFVVVAPEHMLGLATEVRNLFVMLKRARSQSIPVRILTGRQIRSREPYVSCFFGLHIPDVYIIRPELFIEQLATDATNLGTEFVYDQEVIDIKKSGIIVSVITDKTMFSAKMVINAAGLYADKIAGLGGYKYSQVFYRGEYYRVDPSSGITANGLVYPVFRPGAPGLGIHITPKLDGSLLLGPNANRVASNTDYDVNPTPPELFYQSVKTFLPSLKLEHLSRAYAGIRPKLTAERKENDFSINFDLGDIPMVNLIGIESPGLTASMALAEFVSGKLQCAGF